MLNTDAICFAACIMHKTESLESQISGLGVQLAMARSTITNGEPVWIPVVVGLDMLIRCWSKIK